MTMTTSRRAILAGAASISALAMPAIATAAITMPAVATDVRLDPIFELIGNHKQAHAELRDAFGEKDRAEQNWKAEHGSYQADVLLVTRAQWEAEADAPAWPLKGIAGRPPENEIRFASGGALRKFFGRRNARFERELRTKLAGNKRRYRAIFRPIESRIEILHRRISAAEWMIAATPPTSWQGICAVLRYIREEQFVSESLDGNVDALHALLDSIEMAIHDLTGADAPAELATKFDPPSFEDGDRMTAAVA